MRCPFCGESDTRVIDSRLVSDGKQVRRRRECPKCGDRFNTFEVAELALPRVIKRDESRQPFDEEKLRSSVRNALHKRSVNAEQLENLIQEVIHKLISYGEREVKSSLIGELVMERLRSLDQVAYIRFASVYRSFQDVEAFKTEVKKLQKGSYGE